MKLSLPYPFFTPVHHVAAVDARPGVVTGYHLGPAGISVEVTWGDATTTSHWPQELSATFDPGFGMGGGEAEADGE